MSASAASKELDACQPPPSLTAGRRLALQQLADARVLACQRGAMFWEFAVELSHLAAAGANVTDLRWLLVEEYAEHAVDISQPEDTTRRFRPSGNLGFPAGTCFVATMAGARAVESLAERRPEHGTELRCFPLPFTGDAR